MTKKTKNWMTAEELMKELNNDPVYLAKRAAKETRINARFEALETQLQGCIEELNKGGFQGGSLEEVVKINAPLPFNAVKILLDTLARDIELGNKQRLVRALGATRIDFDGTILGQLFEDVRDESFRFVILNTIALTRPSGLDGFIDHIWSDEYRRKQLMDLGFKL
jgi:hypothetical protein